MLKILAGLQSPTRGVVATPKDVTIGYLPQVMILSDNRTVMGEAELAFEHIFELQAKLERMNQELAERTDYDSEEYHQLIDRFTHENDRFLMMGGTNFQAEIPVASSYSCATYPPNFTSFAYSGRFSSNG